MRKAQANSRYVCVVFIAALLSIPGSARSDEFDHLLLWNGGGVVSPRHPHATVRMDSLEVTIEPGRNSYNVDAVFRLFNTGEETSDWVGFLKPEPKMKYRSVTGPPQSFRFDVWVNGVKLVVTEDPEFHGPGIWDRLLSAFSSVATTLGLRPKPDAFSLQSLFRMSWLKAHVRFPGHTGTTIRTRYGAGYFALNTDCVEGWYPVGPGRDWKGRIGKAVILIDCSRVGGAKNVRVGFGTVAGSRLIGDNLLRSEVRNVEPCYGYDFRFEVRRPPEEMNGHGVWGDKE